MENGWPEDFQQYGFTNVSLETLSELEDASFFYVSNNVTGFFEDSAVSTVWDSLEFVKAGHAYPLGGDTWLFGGPLSAEVLVDIVVNSLTTE